MKKSLRVLLAPMLVALPIAVAAHGDEESPAKKPVKSATAPEQKAFGRAGDPRKVTRTLALGMSDAMRYDPAEIRRFPGMEHDESHMAHVKAGAKGAVVWQFNRAGEFYYACLIPGHFEAGMAGKVVVTP